MFCQVFSLIMILITGAAGKTGKAILRALSEKGEPVKASLFHAEQIHEIKALGAKEVALGDLRDANFIKRALQGVHSVYHICPNVHPDEAAIGYAMIDAAAAAGITHFVYHSVLHPQVEAMPHHWKKMRVEESLFASGLPFTILQPAVYMQNVLSNWENIDRTGVYAVPYAVESRLSMVDLEDVAQVAVIVLRDIFTKERQPSHDGATYELVGTPGMSQSEVADILSQHMGHPVIARSVPIDTWKNEARNSGLGEYQVNTLVKMFAYYENFGFTGDSHVLSWLLNRPPTRFDAVVKRAVESRLHLVQRSAGGRNI